MRAFQVIQLIFCGLAGQLTLVAAMAAPISAPQPPKTRFETIDRYPEIPVRDWDQYQSCSLGPETSVTEAEKKGRFTSSGANQKPRILVGDKVAKAVVEQIVARASAECKQGSSRDALTLGAKEALEGQKFLPSLSGTAQLDKGGPLSVLADQRKACSTESLPDPVQRKCCIQGFLSTIPELNAFILAVPDPEEEERRSCRVAYDFGRMHSRFACTHKDKETACAEPIEACIPIRHLGCFHLGYTAYWVSDECKSVLKEAEKEKNNRFKQYLTSGLISDRRVKSSEGSATGTSESFDLSGPSESGSGATPQEGR